MNTNHEKIILDSSAFYTLIRHYKSQVSASYELKYYYFDSQEFSLISRNQTARLRSICSPDFRLQWEFKFNKDITQKTKNVNLITTISAFVKTQDADDITENPDFIMECLPSSIKDYLKDLKTSKKFCQMALFRINRKFLTFDDVLVKADECVYDNNVYYEIGLNSNDREAAKEKMKGILSALSIPFSFSTLSRISKIDSFIPFLDKSKAK